MSKFIWRILRRVWYFNRNVELGRQYKALNKALTRHKALWDKMKDEQRIRVIQEKRSKLFSLAWKYHKLTNSFFDNIEGSVE